VEFDDKTMIDLLLNKGWDLSDEIDLEFDELPPIVDYNIQIEYK
jgi:hypothetical protein